MPRDLLQLSRWVEEAFVDRITLNLQAQAHARGILAELETPAADWPQFSTGLDERLYFSANYLICSGLELLEGVGYEGLGARALVSGAESLEFLAAAPNDSRFGKPLETLKAAVAYHIADHHARAYVLVERIKESRELDDWLSQMILHLLDRNLLALRRITLEVFDSPETNDLNLSEKLASENFDETTAVANLGERSLAGAISIYLEYLKTGSGELLQDALEVLLKVTGLAREARLVDLWWWANALRYLLREFGNKAYGMAFEISVQMEPRPGQFGVISEDVSLGSHPLLVYGPPRGLLSSGLHERIGRAFAFACQLVPAKLASQN